MEAPVRGALGRFLPARRRPGRRCGEGQPDPVRRGRRQRRQLGVPAVRRGAQPCPGERRSGARARRLAVPVSPDRAGEFPGEFDAALLPILERARLPGGRGAQAAGVDPWYTRFFTAPGATLLRHRWADVETDPAWDCREGRAGTLRSRPGRGRSIHSPARADRFDAALLLSRRGRDRQGAGTGQAAAYRAGHGARRRRRPQRKLVEPRSTGTGCRRPGRSFRTKKGPCGWRRTSGSAASTASTSPPTRSPGGRTTDSSTASTATGGGTSGWRAACGPPLERGAG